MTPRSHSVCTALALALLAAGCADLNIPDFNNPSIGDLQNNPTRAGVVTVLDVRPADEFALGHLPGAVNIPLRELEARLAELDDAQEIVAYCRGPYCVLSYEAVAALRARGFKVRRLEDGLPEWRAAGLPIVTGGA